MNKILALLLCLLSSAALAQSSPGLVTRQVPTAAQWNSYFAAKQNVLNYTPLNIAGGIMTGPLITTASTTTAAGLNIPQGTGPASPNNGDIWTTASGLFVQINGSTVGPLGSGGGGGGVSSFNTRTGSVILQAADVSGVGGLLTSNIGTSGAKIPELNGVNTWTGTQLFTTSDIQISGGGTGVTTFTSANVSNTSYIITFPAITGTLVTSADMGTVSNVMLANSAVTVNGTICTLGSSCAAGRILLTGNQNYYVNCSTGNNTNAGTSGAPWHTIQYAYNYVQQNLDLAGQYIVTINLQNAACTNQANTFIGPLVGGFGNGSIKFEGSAANPSVTGATSGFAFQSQGGAQFTVDNFTCIPGAGGGCLLGNGTGASIASGNGMFYETNGGASLFDCAGSGCQITVGNFTLTQVSSNINIVAIAEDDSTIYMSGAATMNGAPGWTVAFVSSDNASTIDGTGFTFSGSIAASSPRWAATLNGVVFTGTNGGTACNAFWAGSSNGSSSTGGQCL